MSDNNPHPPAPDCIHCDDAGCDRCCETEHVTLEDIEHLRAVERAARRLIKEGLRTTPGGLIVREAKDKSDPHYELCTALETIEPLNPRVAVFATAKQEGE